ncbi:hypothetical protein Pint_25612 [Pistacia integerrima]|uniref:Uncharacterized protein n=1 Tax=Pistacia integerrima TaxID=434235 RepID=A0ACC0YHH8_9ROSI|nr:hypothetical protein Pint_25612 [Pistacia integerrima]
MQVLRFDRKLKNTYDHLLFNREQVACISESVTCKKISEGLPSKEVGLREGLIVISYTSQEEKFFISFGMKLLAYARHVLGNKIHKQSLVDLDCRMMLGFKVNIIEHSLAHSR